MAKSLRYAATGLLVITALAGGAVYAPAMATPFTFNYTFGGGSNQTYTPDGPGTLLVAATTVTQGTDQIILTAHDGPPAGAVGEILSYATLPLSVPSGDSGSLINSITVDWGGIYSFVSSSGTYARDTVDDALNFKWLGTFTDSSGVLNSQGAQFTETWSQASPDNQPSVGGTFNSNPSIAVPEPASLWMLGAGLFAIGMVRRRSLGKGRRPARAMMV
ncbi:MAG: PEP-CTERM sorting domain-containing protein [Rhodospirillales bacterium]|nr:PEP-CTERM sorting domain-containing protein [Rhodospirillales bacterium]